MRAVALPHAFGLPAIVAGLVCCATSTASAAAVSTATTPMHSPAHWQLPKALRRQRCVARPLFTRPAWPRRALRSRHHQRAPRKLNVYAVALCSLCARHIPHYTAQAAHAPRRSSFKVRSAFAKKKNRTIRGWGLGASQPPPLPPFLSPLPPSPPLPSPSLPLPPRLFLNSCLIHQQRE
jgi:hypothetical protein